MRSSRSLEDSRRSVVMGVRVIQRCRRASARNRVEGRTLVVRLNGDCGRVWPSSVGSGCAASGVAYPQRFWKVRSKRFAGHRFSR
ncbi:hypothetical protein GBAR_LOCUS575 [Geodia barretti]|uniref:Uncharacterized protein n=1 Tax=Geodia barretti TaxID=519541 RepID=A0AA35VYM6_GEOBA|nr:hypothetical protein GBAR_LOCUS575 [Geodia barretti]